MKTSDKPIANPLAVLREDLDEWAVLFNPDTADAVGINPVGIMIWKRMDGTRTVAQLAAEVRDAYRDVPETAAAEIASFVDDLADKGFVGLEQHAVV